MVAMPERKKDRKDDRRGGKQSGPWEWLGGDAAAVWMFLAVVGGGVVWATTSFALSVGTWLAGGEPWSWPGVRVAAQVLWKSVAEGYRPDEAWLLVSGADAVASWLWLLLLAAGALTILFLLIALVWAAADGGNPFAGWGDRARTRPVRNFLVRQWPAPPPYTPRKPGAGVLLGKRRSRLVASSDGLPVLVLGPTGSGKTRHLIGPNSAHWPGPAVITSVKTDLAELTLPHRKQLGKCYGFDPAGRLWDWMRKSGITPVVWDPVRLLAEDRSKEHADLLAQFLASQSSANDAGSQSIWAGLAQQIISDCLYLAAAMGQPLSAVLEWVVDLDGFVSDKELPWKKLDLEGKQVLASVQNMSNKDDRLSGSVEITIQEIVRSLEHTGKETGSEALLPVGLTTLSESDTLFLVADHLSQKTHKPVFAAVLRHLFHATESYLPEEDVAPPRPLFALDEMANLAKLPDLPEVLSTIRSKAQVVIGIQERSQLEAGWGAANAKTVIGNCPVKVQLPGSSDASALSDWEKMSGDPDDEEGAAGWRTIKRGRCRIIAGNHRVFEVEMSDPDRWLKPPKPGRGETAEPGPEDGNEHGGEPVGEEPPEGGGEPVGEDFPGPWPEDEPDPDGDLEELAVHNVAGGMMMDPDGGEPVGDDSPAAEEGRPAGEPPPGPEETGKRPQSWVPKPPPPDHMSRLVEKLYKEGYTLDSARKPASGQKGGGNRPGKNPPGPGSVELPLTAWLGNEPAVLDFAETPDGELIAEVDDPPRAGKRTGRRTRREGLAEVEVMTLSDGEPVGAHQWGFVVDMSEGK